MAKPTKPDISIPTSFADTGQKTDFTEEKLQNGFDSINPDVLAGDNLNKFIDDTYKGLNYSIDSIEYLYNLNNKDFINQSKALKTGNVSNNPDVYAEVLSYAHSTFDLSKFTVVGSPTITDEGVASGFNGSNYIRIPFPSSVTNFTAELNFKFNDTSVASYSNYCIHASVSPFMIYINASNGKYGNINPVFTNSDVSTQYNFGNISGSSHFLTERVYFEYRLLNNILSCRMRFGETGDWINFPKTYTITDVILTKAYYLLTSSAFNCDLKHFSITVDGKEVFSGNKTGLDVINDVEIPYTLSKTGSKIVDVAYRDRVIDLYEQEGQAGYYTIDEENQNFTLPMGEIYGMIENNSTDISTKVSKSGDTMTGTLNFNLTNNAYPIVINTDGNTGDSGENLQDIEFRFGGKRISFLRTTHRTNNTNYLELNICDNAGNKKDSFIMSYDPSSDKVTYNKPQIISTYVNGASGYRIWSDGYCEQWGKAANSQAVVTFFKTYASTNYNAQGTKIRGNSAYGPISIYNQKVSSFQLGSNDDITDPAYWFVRGYLASGQY